MLESISSNNIFEYQKLTPEEQQKRGILGRLVGVMADSKNPTRNNRRYNADLWEKVFNNPIMKEKIENRVCFGEACHPIDGREEVDPEKVAICLAEVPKKNSKGQLIGVFDVLDTPCGRILKTMLDYGANIGVSSRGSGDVTSNFDGTEDVDPDSYECVCWDAVFVPAVKEARLKYVTESYGGKTLKQALTESLESASEEERKIMEDTLSDLNIDIDLKEEPLPVDDELIDANTLIEEDNVVNDESLNINEDDNDLAVDDVEADTINDLQEALRLNSLLEKRITELQEKLSVSYAKEEKLMEQLSSQAKLKKNLSESKQQVKALSERVNSLTNKVASYKDTIYEKDSKIKELVEDNRSNKLNKNSLHKEVEKNEKLIESLKEQVNSLQNDKSNKEKELNESISSMQAKYEDSQKVYSQKLSKANKLVEKYKDITNKVIDRYISSQANLLGVSSNEIKNRLPESYTFDDIDSVCESLREYKLNISKLPFRTSNLTENVKIKATASKQESILPAIGSFDDEVDNSLINMAGL